MLGFLRPEMANGHHIVNNGHIPRLELLELTSINARGGGWGGGGGRCCQVQRGAAPALRVWSSKVFRGRRNLFYDLCMSAICKRWDTFLYPYTRYGGENPLTIHKISAALMPSDCRRDWTFESAAAKQAEDYKI